MAEPVLLDTGPLVAVLSKDEEHHQRCTAEIRLLRRTPVTCWPLLTEATHLLRGVPGAVDDLFRIVVDKEIYIHELVGAGEWLRSFLRRYESAGADLADDCMMYLAEHLRLETVFTIDRRHFGIYRTTQGAALHVIP